MKLWKDLSLYKKIVGNAAWTIMGDVNVSLSLDDHSKGISHFTQDMLEFQDYINEIEIDDLNYYGLHFTLTKSLLNPNAIVLKKSNKGHRKQFFFGLNVDIPDHAMFRLVKKLKASKTHLNKLNWKNGNLFGKLADLKGKLHSVKERIDLNPSNKILRGEEVMAELVRENYAVTHIILEPMKSTHMELMT
ncbi:hypothetical protein Tco_1389915 [Tanacetum coccineum]